MVGLRDRRRTLTEPAFVGRDTEVAVLDSRLERVRQGEGELILLEAESGRKEIRAALTEAKPNDTVVIAGKGHETYQTIGTTSFPFDDRVVARELLDELVAGRN